MSVFDCILKMMRQPASVAAESLQSGEFRMLVQRHRLLPQFAKALEAKGLEVDQELRGQLRRHAMKSMAITAESVALFSRMKHLDGDLMVLKGPVLSCMLYGSPDQRQYNDLDVYVKPDAFGEVLADLQQAGYRVSYPDMSKAFSLEYYFRYKHDIGLRHPETGVYIELHRGINSRQLLPVGEEDALFACQLRVPLPGGTVASLDYTAQFIFLCIHGARHMFKRLIWLQDLAGFLPLAAERADELPGLVRRFKLQRITGLCLVLLDELLEVPTPEEWAVFRSVRGVSVLRKLCVSGIAGPEEEELSAKWKRNLYFFLLKPGWSFGLHQLGSYFHRRRIRRQFGGH
ncbi:MAG: hypothetical protein CSA96_00365 [Bacteroidetes bacterium]|nr:MAG: hypothetical protein CSA96_00365 [Bacteroidota bacterium]